MGQLSGQRRSSVRHRPVLVVGVPRSGTTWTKQVLEQDRSLVALMEPDSEGYRAAAIGAKRTVGRFPLLAPGEWDEPYFRLWTWILAGAPETARQRLAGRVLLKTSPTRRSNYFSGKSSPLMSLAGAIADLPVDRRNPDLVDKGLLVKTVHAPLSIEWVASEFDVDVLVVLRHPGSILASWLDVKSTDQSVRFGDDPKIRRLAASWDVPPPGPDPLERTVWQIGVLVCALRQALAGHPEWMARTHEQLCADPAAEFHALYDQLGLTWTDDCARYLKERDRQGAGYVTKRVASTLPGNWRTRLTDAQQQTMSEVLARFPDRAGLED